jgi:hypothetical protein
MPSSGTGADISRKEAEDLLHKLITESIKVQAVFHGRGGVGAALCGFVSRPAPDTILVTEGGGVTAPSLFFGLNDVAGFKYGDDRVFPGAKPRLPEAPRLNSALAFVYPDGTQIGLFEIAERP